MCEAWVPSNRAAPVSYTHLDVYKRQEYLIPLVDKLVSICVKARAKNMDPATAIVKEVERLMEEDDLITRRCGYFAATLIDDGDGILTHCYPGGALIYMLDEVGKQGKEVGVFCSEPRPYLQGARLTAESVSKLGVETKIITDNMGALLMWQGKIQKLITACDRITMNGHIANKIGTYPVSYTHLAVVHSARSQSA